MMASKIQLGGPTCAARGSGRLRNLTQAWRNLRGLELARGRWAAQTAWGNDFSSPAVFIQSEAYAGMIALRAIAYNRSGGLTRT